MNTFKPGQKIRRARGASMYIRIGEEATVATVDRDARLTATTEEKTT